MITVYGADWCEDTQRALRHLRRLGVTYSYENVDRDPEALGRAKALNRGERRTPTIDVDGETLVEPTNRELTAALVQRQLISEDEARGRLRYRNVGDLERALRLVGGAAALACAVPMKSRWKWPLAAWGAFEVVTGGIGSCPLYAALGVSSFGGPGDRPFQAERNAWLAPILPKGVAAPQPEP